MRCIKGEILDVAVDIRPKSKYYGQWVSAILSEQNKFQLYIPEGFAHGYYVISDFAEIAYKCSDIYYPEDEVSLLWNDPSLAIDWPSNNPILSKRDISANSLEKVFELLDC